MLEADLADQQYTIPMTRMKKDDTTAHAKRPDVGADEVNARVGGHQQRALGACGAGAGQGQWQTACWRLQHADCLHGDEPLLGPVHRGKLL